MKLPKKKENDRQRMECNEDLYTMRKKFHQVKQYFYSICFVFTLPLQILGDC